MKAAWWNGVFTTLSLINVGYFLHTIWIHDVNGILASLIIGFALFCAHFITLVEMK
jgi:hypothetical protein